MTSILLASYFAAPVSLARGQAGAVVLKMLSGESLEGEVLAIGAGSVMVKSGDDTKKIGYDELASIDFGLTGVSPAASAALIELTDGSRLNTKSLTIDSRTLQIKLSCGSDLEVNSRYVQSIRFKTYEHQSELGKQWQEILADHSRRSDAIVINRNLELATLEGIVGDIAEDKLSFSIEERSARVAVDKLDAILFYHASGKIKSTPVCEIRLADNSRLLVQKLELNRPRIRVTFACGAIADLPIDEVVSMKFSLKQEMFLSSTRPSTNDWQPLITSAAVLEKLRKMKLARTNQSFSGKPLSLRFETQQPQFQARSGLSFQTDVRQFENGFAIQGGGKLAFALNGKYQKLTGLVGFDPDVNASGNVVLKVILDGKTVMEEELIQRFMDNPLEIDLNIGDVQRVVFQVDYNDGRSTGDQIHLVDLKVAQSKVAQ